MCMFCTRPHSFEVKSFFCTSSSINKFNMPAICQSAAKPLKRKGSVLLPNTVFFSSDVILCDTCLLHPHYQHSPAAVGLWWILHTLVITRGGRRASALCARWSPLASLWRSTNQASQSWSLHLQDKGTLNHVPSALNQPMKRVSSVWF